MPFSKDMAFIIRALQMILIISMLASMHFLHFSHRPTTSSGFLTETAMAEQTSTTTTQELESKNRFSRLRGGGSVQIVEKRLVPTGPDPLHHNSDPTRP